MQNFLPYLTAITGLVALLVLFWKIAAWHTEMKAEDRKLADRFEDLDRRHNALATEARTQHSALAAQVQGVSTMTQMMEREASATAKKIDRIDLNLEGMTRAMHNIELVLAKRLPDNK